MKRVLVTGCSGYIGQNLVKLLQQKNVWVTGLDKNDQLPYHMMGDEVIHQNILDSKLIDTEFDTVIHLAALVQVGGGQKAAMDYYRTNVVGTMNMLERVQYKNFIFASTCQACSPNVYGHSKYIAETIIRQYAVLNNKNYSIFRFGNVIGNGNLTNTDGLMYNLIKAKETGTFNLYGDGSALRDYIHVDEVCHAILKAIDRPSCVAGAEVQPMFEYLGHGRAVTVKQCIEAFKKVNDCEFDVVVKPKREGDVDETKTYLTSPYMPLTIKSLESMMRV
jgi:nucleoside-diphosphate-sugar epimerase